MVVNKLLRLKRPYFEFLLNVKVMGLNAGYLLKSFFTLQESMTVNSSVLYSNVSLGCYFTAINSMESLLNLSK